MVAFRADGVPSPCGYSGPSWFASGIIFVAVFSYRVVECWSPESSSDGIRVAVPMVASLVGLS